MAANTAAFAARWTPEQVQGDGMGEVAGPPWPFA